ncbi:TetR/AcrR family transcriptional regulator [Streptomyces sp. NPDC014894]|uniref:TetR/AcrR family transcriptional regulator n=1 Tax=unclassified Streptomyces TaxID=2593676 RepID=UPI0037013CE9
MAHVTAAERRPQLIAAAIELMAREGVTAGSTRAIAAELGVAQATVHYTFGTKADLYRAVLEFLTEDLLAGVQRSVARATSLEEALRATADAFLLDLDGRPELNLLWFELIAFSLRSPELREVVERYHEGIADIATEALTQTERRGRRAFALPAADLARFLLSGLDGLGLHLLVRGEGPADDSTRRALDLLVTATVALAYGGAGAPGGEG